MVVVTVITLAVAIATLGFVIDLVQDLKKPPGIRGARSAGEGQKERRARFLEQSRR